MAVIISIAHPCYDTPHSRNLRHEEHRTYAIEVADYFEVSEGEADEWLFAGSSGIAKVQHSPIQANLKFWAESFDCYRLPA